MTSSTQYRKERSDATAGGGDSSELRRLNFESPKMSNHRDSVQMCELRVMESQARIGSAE